MYICTYICVNMTLYVCMLVYVYVSICVYLSVYVCYYGVCARYAYMRVYSCV